ncbi:methyltransferase [Actinosynnema sp. CS-041913]|uniref:methyltransferase n=1 Tax=Actinosynnema sp. CS-041913 TaxID=3239917 RepID=UPI003D8ADD75
MATSSVDRIPASHGRSHGDRGEQHEVMMMLAGKWVAGTLTVLARLGVADLLARGPRAVPDLAAATGSHAPTLYRFLRAAASVGVFAEREDGRFELTPKAEYLCSDVPGTLRYLAYFYGEPTVWNCFGYAADTVRTGEPNGRRLRNGKNFFEYLEQDAPEFASAFHKAMSELNDERAPRIADSFDFGRFPRIADIGGGQGRLLAAILRRYPDSRGVLFDIATAIATAPPVLEAQGVADRVELVAGSFFDGVPSGVDAYVLKAVMHDWADDLCVGVLKRIREAIGPDPDARVLIIDGVLPTGNDPHYSKLMDIAMAVTNGGRERTAHEWSTLLAEAGFETVAIHPTVEPHGIVEGRPLPRR